MINESSSLQISFSMHSGFWKVYYTILRIMQHCVKQAVRMWWFASLRQTNDRAYLLVITENRTVLIQNEIGKLLAS